MIYVAQKAHKNITHLCKAPIQGALEIRKRNNLQMGYHPFGGPGRHQTCTSSLTINFQPDCQFISPLYPSNQLAWKYIQWIFFQGHWIYFGAVFHFPWQMKAATGHFVFEAFDALSAMYHRASFTFSQPPTSLKKLDHMLHCLRINNFNMAAHGCWLWC